LICASLPNDVAESFGLLAPHLGKILTSVPGEVYPNLPSESDLRPVVCQGLENLVESFYLLSSVMVEDTDDQVKQQWKSVCNKVGVEAITKIKTYVNRFLSALCNIYVTVDPKIGNGKATGQALQVIHEKSIQYFEKPIKKFLLIADKKAVGEYMATLVKSILEKQQGDMTVVDRLGVYAIMDLNLILLPNLDKDMVGVVEMYYQLLMDQVTTTDATLQKKTYKSLVHVVQHVGIDQINQLELSKVLLIDTKIATGAYRPRIQLIQTLVTLTKNKQLLLDFIPRVIPEIMLATKEASEKTRDGAYDCLVEMAKKMMNGADALLVGDGLDTVMQSISLTEGSADSDIEKNHKGEISIKEFMMMVAAGLTGDDVHMHSASIASMGRLLFEFHGIVL
jgi:hypothetical protein